MAHTFVKNKNVLTSLQLVLCHVAAERPISTQQYLTDFLDSFCLFKLILSNRVLLKLVLVGGGRAWPVSHITVLVISQLDRVFYFRFLAVFVAFIGSNHSEILILHKWSSARPAICTLDTNAQS